MRTAICDPEAFYPLRSLVSGPVQTLNDVPAIERFLRTVLLHDEFRMALEPWPYVPEVDFEQEQAGGRNVITAIGPVLTGYDFFAEPTGPLSAPAIELTPALIDLASQHANAGEGNVYFKAHVAFLKIVLGVVKEGGSALLQGEFGSQVIDTATRYPEALFHQLDRDWQNYTRQIQEDGLGLLIPPVLGIVLTRCARRDAIPAVIRDLRDEWAGARRKVWDLLDALRIAHTLGEAIEIRRQLSEAAKLFAPEPTEHDSRPVRVLWEIIAGALVGAGTAAIAGGSPDVGAVTGAVAQVPRSVPALIHEFGRSLFGRGAFDLARRVRRAVAQVEFEALPRLLTDAEKQRLGFR